MGKLSNISARSAVKKFCRAGYFVDHQTGSHIILYNHKARSLPLSIPNHKELAPGLLRAQIKRAGLTIEEFLKLKQWVEYAIKEGRVAEFSQDPAANKAF